MLGKLLKYDFRSMWKQFAIVWPAAVVLALVNHFVLWLNIDYTSQFSGVLSTVLMFVFIGILFGMLVLSLIFVIQRFYKGILGDEGYLMHTLPVRPWQLMVSKLICAVVLIVISVIVALLSISLIYPATWEEYGVVFGQVGKVAADLFSSGSNVLALFEVLLVLVVSLVQACLMLYLAMAVGHLFNKNRLAASVIAYVALDTVVGIVIGLFGFSAVRAFFSLFSPHGHGFAAMTALHAVLWAVICSGAVLSAIYFFATNYILSRKLNLG